MNKDSNYVCPIPATHDKFDESHYFLHRSMEEFHKPEPFRWNLNAFLQALRSVTNILESELKPRNRKSFKSWYSDWEIKMQQDELLQKFILGRNTVVHRGMLQHKSRVETGLFRGYQMKLGFEHEIDINLPSSVILRHMIETDPFDYIDAEHSTIGEQLGIRRTWIVEDLGQNNEDVLNLCHRAWSRISQIVSAAHEFAGAKLPSVEESNDVHDITRISVLLESDLDPTLPKQWGWE